MHAGRRGVNVPAMRARLIERDGEKCARCHSTSNLTVDHIVPRSRRGNDSLVNLQLLCLPCNLAKANTVEHEMMTPERMKPRPKRKKRRSLSSWHLPQCDGVFCMYGCPVFHGLVPGEKHPERVW